MSPLEDIDRRMGCITMCTERKFALPLRARFTVAF